MKFVTILMPYFISTLFVFAVFPHFWSVLIYRCIYQTIMTDKIIQRYLNHKWFSVLINLIYVHRNRATCSTFVKKRSNWMDHFQQSAIAHTLLPILNSHLCWSLRCLAVIIRLRLLELLLENYCNYVYRHLRRFTRDGNLNFSDDSPSIRDKQFCPTCR